MQEGKHDLPGEISGVCFDGWWRWNSLFITADKLHRRRTASNCSWCGFQGLPSTWDITENSQWAQAWAAEAAIFLSLNKAVEEVCLFLIFQLSDSFFIK